MFNTYPNNQTARPGTDPFKEMKKVKLEAIRDYHQDLINDLGIDRKDFNMKMAFYDKQARYVVGIFDSEFKKEKGFFFELIDRDCNPLDQDRTVYRIAPNENYAEEYEQNEKGSFLVPLEELRVVNTQSVAISKSSAVTTTDKLYKTNPTPKVPIQAYKAPEKMEDAPYTEMTIRDYMAIQTGKPVSTKAWLNELVKTSK